MARRRPAKATMVGITKGGRSTPKGMNSVMILPQVHLRNGTFDEQPARFPWRPDYILSSPKATHNHLVCERSPWP